MAIVQISRITNRKGLTENLPQLAGAEFGWCLDSRRLFIGNGTLQEGAPVIGNTEILTQFSDLTELSEYTYKDAAVGYIAQTGPTAGDPVVRTVQAKLDDFADVRDFGAVGDGLADDTAAINRALFQLYCRETNPQIRRTLYFPAGLYKVTDVIVIPTFAKLVGEGAECSIIFQANAAKDYVARYGDSLQQVGANIGNNGAIPPQNIEISSMTFELVAGHTVVLVEDATQCWFDSVNFIGQLTKGDISTNLALDDIAGVRFASTPVLTTNNITFDKCAFTNLTYGIQSNDMITGVTVSNSRFDTLYQGVALGNGALTGDGPTGFRTVHNFFDNVYAEGVYYGTVNLNVTAHNIFYDVGNKYSGTAQTPVILFDYDNNVSISDMFARQDGDNLLYPRVQITGGETTTGTLIQIGRYARTSGRTFTLANNITTPDDIFSVNSVDTKAFKMYYTITRSSSYRHGIITVASAIDSGSPLTLSYDDEYTENSTSGITFTVTQTGAIVTVYYTSTNTGDPGELTYSLEYLA